MTTTASIRMRRRLRRNSQSRLIDISAKDCELIAYYLYKISEIINEIDSNLFYAQQAKLLFKLAEKLNRKEALSAFLKEKVRESAEKGELTPISEDEGLPPYKKSILVYDSSDVSYEYEEDKSIDRKMPGGEFKIDENTVNLYRCLYLDDNKFFCRLVANFLIKKTAGKQFSLLESTPARIKKLLSDDSAIRFITDSVELDKNESRYLLLSYQCLSVAPLNSLLDSMNADDLLEFKSRILGISHKELFNIYKRTSPLRMFGFVDDEGNLEKDIVECIINQSMDSFFADLVKEDNFSKSYKLDSFNVNKSAGIIMQKMLSGDENISLLLYGKPGSGKTEYAKALAKSTGKKALVFKNEAEISKNGNNSDNILCRLNLLLSINRSDSVLIIDEADTLLKTRAYSFFGMEGPSKNKGIVNKMLELCKNKIIWIVNFTNQIDESTLRRFNFSYKFEAMSREQLRSITSLKLKPLNLPESENSEILNLMEKYSITGASVDNVVKTIKSLNDSDSEELVDCIHTILKENSHLISGNERIRENVTPSYDIRAINASMDPEQIVQMIKNAQEFAEKNHSVENGIRMIFYGLIGTGKTEFARYISQQLGKKILLKRASDILDKYVGGSEKNIRDAFEEASSTDSILLFDEADSFFADRNFAKQSWERTQVNEFLTQMEEFRGIMICTTNLKKIMDPAMNRRFHMIVEFKPLNENGIRCMLSRYFGAYEFSDRQIARLDRLSSVTPGDFGLLSNKMRFMNSGELNSDYITSELCKIQDEKDSASCKKIGFSA
ncbi:MAG: ATP-binding protein [Treponema sp.]|nr:ATP-binding protein [Treponema sp.]